MYQCVHHVSNSWQRLLHHTYDVIIFCECFSYQNKWHYPSGLIYNHSERFINNFQQVVVNIWRLNTEEIMYKVGYVIIVHEHNCDDIMLRNFGRSIVRFEMREILNICVSRSSIHIR